MLRLEQNIYVSVVRLENLSVPNSLFYKQGSYCAFVRFLILRKEKRK